MPGVQLQTDVIPLLLLSKCIYRNCTSATGDILAQIIQTVQNIPKDPFAYSAVSIGLQLVHNGVLFRNGLIDGYLICVAFRF